MSNKNTVIVIIILVVVAAVLILGVSAGLKSGPTGLGSFAACLKDKGVVFYGAFWCPHCQNQKALFGNAVGELPYVECSTPDGHGQTQVCIDKGIEQYPTWVFPDGSRLTGEVPLQTLAEKSGCQLPTSTTP